MPYNETKIWEIARWSWILAVPAGLEAGAGRGSALWLLSPRLSEQTHPQTHSPLQQLSNTGGEKSFFSRKYLKRLYPGSCAVSSE